MIKNDKIRDFVDDIRLSLVIFILGEELYGAFYGSMFHVVLAAIICIAFVTYTVKWQKERGPMPIVINILLIIGITIMATRTYL